MKVIKSISYLLIVVSGLAMASEGHKTHTLQDEQQINSSTKACIYSGGVVITQKANVACKATIKK